MHGQLNIKKCPSSVRNLYWSQHGMRQPRSAAREGQGLYVTIALISNLKSIKRPPPPAIGRETVFLEQSSRNLWLTIDLHLMLRIGNPTALPPNLDMSTW